MTKIFTICSWGIQFRNWTVAGLKIYYFCETVLLSLPSVVVFVFCFCLTFFTARRLTALCQQRECLFSLRLWKGFLLQKTNKREMLIHLTVKNYTRRLIPLLLRWDKETIGLAWNKDWKQKELTRPAYWRKLNCKWWTVVFLPTQAGLYRLSGADRTVKELKEKFLRGKAVPVLSKVDDIHAVTGLLKDFLRNLKEPLLTFRLNRTFMDAAGKCVRCLKLTFHLVLVVLFWAVMESSVGFICQSARLSLVLICHSHFLFFFSLSEVSDDDNSIALMYQTISDLPQPNRDTLAFLVLHLKRLAAALL